MSCILVGLGTINLKPSQMTARQLLLLTSRDLIILSAHSFLLYRGLTSRGQERDCINASSVYPWLFFDLFITILRLIKNPVQFMANGALARNGSGWSNPEELPRWTRWVEGRQCCQMRIYTVVDWLSYLTWIVGGKCLFNILY